jgi:HK97 family phage major capsid protein
VSTIRGLNDEIGFLNTTQQRDGLSAGQTEHLSRLESQRDRLAEQATEMRMRAEERERRSQRITERIRGDGGTTYDPAVGSDAQTRALHALDRLGGSFRGRAGDEQDRLIREDPRWAVDFEVRSRPEYLSAFGKILRAGSVGEASIYMSDAERISMHDMAQARALAEGATTTGGFAVPIVIDPSVILTNQENVNPFIALSRMVNITSNQWRGISAAGVVWSFDAEASEVSDDSPTLAQPTVNVYMARGFIPYSIEVGEDWPGFQEEMARILSAGYDELLLSKFTSGSGTGEPRGIITALDANTNSQVMLTTAGTFGVGDLYNTWAALPPKYHRAGAWQASVGVINKVRAFGQANVYHAYTVDLQAGSVEVLFGRQVYENPYFTDFTGTTSHNLLVVGDWSNYVIARRTGLSVELVPHLFGPANRQPTGQRGMFCYARIGGNSVNDSAFRVLNQT